jgi:hypothetical protein
MMKVVIADICVRKTLPLQVNVQFANEPELNAERRPDPASLPTTFALLAWIN